MHAYMAWQMGALYEISASSQRVNSLLATHTDSSVVDIDG